MSDYPVTRGARPGDPHPRLRLAALTAVIVGVILVALAAFLFSYAGIHQIALQAGVSPGLARLYPLMFDAMLIITCSAVLATRTAGWGTKTYVWVCLLLVVGAVAVGDALYATGVHLTGQAARATIAVIPWVLLLLGFGIWLVMLRHWRRIRMGGAIDGAEAGRAAPAGRNGRAGRAAAADRARQTAPAIPTGQAGRAAPAMAAGAAAGAAAAGGAASWPARRGATSARTRAPQMGIDTLLEQRASRAPERAPAADSPAAADRAAATGQGKQRTATPGERQPAGPPATVAGTAAGAAAGTAAGIAAAKVAGATTGTRPGTPGDTKPVTAGETGPGTAETTAGTAAGTKPGTTGTRPRASDTDAGADPRTGAGATGAGATGAGDPAEAGRDEGGKDKAPAQERRRRLGGLLETPASADDEEAYVRILPAEPKAAPGDAAPKAEGEEGTPAGTAAAATEPDPANPPAPLPHFDRPRSTPTPPQETGADEE
jgi:Protein of unknown function (DUF2637)